MSVDKGKIQEYIEKAKIQEVIVRYGDSVNRRDWAALAAVFTPDAIWEIDGTPRVRYEGAEVVPGIQGLVDAMTYLFHVFAPSLIEIDGDAATARTALQETGEADAGRYTEQKSRIVAYVIYNDTFRKVSGKWLMARRRCQILKTRFIPVED
jgi:ketosteroid isomerase-like protein